MTAYERVARVHVTDGIAVEVTSYGRPDHLELVVTSTWTAWQGTDREAVRYERLDAPYGVTTDELRALAAGLVAVADDLEAAP